MLTKTFHSIRGMFERLLNMYKEKSTRGLLVLMAAFACGFIWPLLGATRCGLDPAFRKARGRRQHCRHGGGHQHRYLLRADSNQNCLQLNLI